MQQAVNFYELKTQLADLGFNQPEVADQLRSLIANDDYHSGIVHTRQDGVHFQFELDRNNSSAYEILFYTAELHDNSDLLPLYFQPEVTAAEAIDQVYKQLNHYKIEQTMNTENLSYLQKQLLNLGFGEKLNNDLEEKIKSKEKEFTLGTSEEYNKQNVDYTLHYKAGDQNDMYFFNKYDASLRDKDTQQTFYINKGGAITAKEAYNLLEGRAVHKQLENLEGEKYKAWIIIDKENKTDNGNYKLRPFTDGWNYKPERAIDKLDIVGINEEGARDKLMKSLEKGNRHQVTAMKDGKEVKLFLEANPAEHRINLTNWKGEAQQLEHYKKQEFKQDAKKDQKQTEKQAEEGTKKKRGKGQKMSA